MKSFLLVIFSYLSVLIILISKGQFQNCHYNYFDIDNLILQTEFLCAKNLKLINLINLNYSNKERDDGIYDLFSISKILNKLPKAFTETYKIINILLTLPVATASNERFFFFP
jgi:hypothetical protein